VASRLIRVTGTGAAYSGKCILKSVALQGGSANSTALVQDTTAGGGTDVLGLAAVIGSSAVWRSGDDDGVPFTAGVYVTLAGTGASCSIEVEV